MAEEVPLVDNIFGLYKHSFEYLFHFDELLLVWPVKTNGAAKKRMASVEQKIRLLGGRIIVRLLIVSGKLNFSKLFTVAKRERAIVKIN